MKTRRYEAAEDMPYGPGNPDYECDEARQRLVDAYGEGYDIGLQYGSVEMCRYYSFGAEYNEWHRGRLDAIARLLMRRVA